MIGVAISGSISEAVMSRFSKSGFSLSSLSRKSGKFEKSVIVLYPAILALLPDELKDLPPLIQIIYHVSKN